jgi:hypothetical protein
MHKTEGKCILGFGKKNVKEKECLEDLDVDGRILSLFQEI